MRTALILTTLLFSASLSFAQAPNTVFLEDLTWTEAREAIDNGTTTIIIATAGTEQNGPHVTLGKHNSRMRVASERIARTLGNTLVAPVIAFVPEGAIDPPAGHMTKAGTISIPPEVFSSLVEYTARSLKQHGFTDIILIGDSGGNQQPMAEVAELLNQEWEGISVRLHYASEWYSSGSRYWEEVLVPRGETEETIGFHAGLFDTALSLAMAPQDVRTWNMSPGKGMEVDGVSGDPTRATYEIGVEAYNFMFDATIAQIRELMDSE